MKICSRRMNSRKILLTGVIVVSILLMVSAFASAEPRILSVSPANFTQMDSGNVTITATVYDPPAWAVLKIDDAQVNAVVEGKTISYSGAFSTGLHRVDFTVSDGTEQTAERFWMFYVNTPGSYMLSPGNNNPCRNCHDNEGILPESMSFPGHMVDPTYTAKPHPQQCGACHYFKAGETRLIFRGDGSDLIVLPDGRICTSCHTPHNAMNPSPLLIFPSHNTNNWVGNWVYENTPIKAPREPMDCQYCHQPGTKVRLGHDLVSDHEAEKSECLSCHSAILTVEHNKNTKDGVRMTCATCHRSTDPVVRGVAKLPRLARAGTHVFTNNNPPLTIVTQVYNDLNLASLTITVNGPDARVKSPVWSPGPGLQIKRITVDGWNPADRQYIKAYVERENKWYVISVADEGQTLYGRYPSTSMARIIYLPPFTTEIVTEVVSNASADPTYSTGLEVKEAYYNDPVSCSDCHTQVNHEAAHSSGLNAACQSCHMAGLTQEHMANSVTQATYDPATGKTALTCNTCHASTDKAVKRTIAISNLDCTGCHTQGHNVNFVGTVPADIPLYSGFTWSTPMESALFMGEQVVPYLYENGQVVISNRRSDVTALGVLDYYKTELVANGWTIQNLGDQSGPSLATGQFRKGDRGVVMKCYNTENCDGTGQSTSGFRILLCYK